MITHELKQGTPEWLAYRTAHDNASDAPAMMSCSSYKTRDQLIAELATGIVPEVDAATQRLYDSGHRAEKLARPLAEEIIGKDLYPCTGSLEDSRLSASFDGLTMLEDVAFEHKRLNQRLRAALSVPGCTGADLPLEYQVQMEQQCAVSRCEKVLFMASDWDGQDQLIEEMHCWYTPNPALRAQIIAGWAQLHKEVAAYVPPEPKPAPVVAAPVETLPAVSVRVDGQLAIVSNLPAFGAALRNFIDRIPVKPSTDQEFADTEAACKALKQTEDALEAAESNALAQLADVDTMRRFVADYRALARTTRLQREKLVAQRKEEIRGEIVAGGVAALRDHIAALNERLGKPYMPTVAADFAGAIKGKRTVDSLRGAVNDELARAKIAANEIADRIQINLNTLREHASHHAFLFSDTPTIVLKAADDLTTLVKSRIAEHEAAKAKELEAERERIRAEELVKVQAAQKEEDELIARIWEAARRIEGPRVGYVQKAIGYFESGPGKYIDDHRTRVVDAVTAARAEMQQKLFEAQEREASDRAEYEAREKLLQGDRDAQEAIQQAKEVGQVAAPLAEDLSALAREKTQEAVAGLDAQQAIGMAQRAAAVAPVARTGTPTLSIGTIKERLAHMTVTAENLRALGFEPAGRERSAPLYHDDDFPAMCDAIAKQAMAAKAQFLRDLAVVAA